MIILVILVVTGYMVQAAAIQKMDERALLQYLLNNMRGCSDIGDPCTRSRDCCGNPGSAYEGPAPRCDYDKGVCAVREK